jgi:carbonic anhydrase
LKIVFGPAKRLMGFGQRGGAVRRKQGSASVLDGHPKLEIMRILTFFSSLVLFVLVTNCQLTPAAGGQRAERHATITEHDWGYEGVAAPDHWAELSPEFIKCAEGHFQSPIDIESFASQDAQSIDLDFDYHACTLDIENNGHTIQANPEADNAISYHGTTYHLKQFHFHEPSEHRIDGIVYPMELHLVHADSSGRLAVIGLFIKEGPANEVLQELWTLLPEEKQAHSHLEHQCNIPGLIPPEHTTYHYQGSLTTPPCSEGVDWFIIEQPISLAPAQIEKFRHLYHGNNRPVMPKSDRLVEIGK